MRTLPLPATTIPTTTATHVSWYALLTPLLRGWRVIALTMFMAGAITAAVVLLSARKYRATMTLSTVFNPRMALMGGGLGALLNANTSMGLQATPALIVLLSTQYGVLERVSRAPIARTGGEIIGDRLRTLEDRSIPRRDLPLALKKQFSSGIDKLTGVITISVVSRDSVFARAVAAELVSEISRTFIRSSKSQATELREAMQARVDSAVKQLRRADEEFRAFNAANRIVAPYSETSLRRDELERTRNLSQTIYTQAVTDRESAVSRELEETPAVVVLDGLPRELLREPRRTAIKSIAAAFAAFILAALVLLLRAGMQRSDAEAELADFAAAMASIPVIGWLLTQLLGMRGLRRPGAAAPDPGAGAGRS